MNKQTVLSLVALSTGFGLIGCASTTARTNTNAHLEMVVTTHRSAASFSVPASLQRPQHEGHVVLFGNLHAHSSLSDDVHGGDEMLPIRAFEAAHAAGLDFMAITDHQQAPRSGRFSMTLDEYQTKLFDVAMEYNSDHPGQFIAIPGMECGVISDGNHINIFGATTLPPDSIGRREYDKLIAWAGENAEFIQFNHPYSWSSKGDRTIGNYGQNLYSTEGTVEFVEAVDPVVKSMSVICTVHGGHISGEFAKATNKSHRDIHQKHYSIYKKFLNMGFHLSPAANQDTHRTNWGTVTAARTAVWAESASYEDLMAGINANRIYATEDDEMAVVFQVEYNRSRYWMGESVPLDAEEDDIEVIVKVWQANGSDGDSTSEGPYTVSVYSDYDGIGGRSAALWTTIEDIPAGQEFSVPLQVVRGEYIYLQVTEQGGADNPTGDGDDEIENATGAHVADGFRDDMNDSAWTTPVWFIHPATGADYVWSKNSKLYHDSDCWAVKRIGLANRREGVVPDGKVKHDCN